MTASAHAPRTPRATSASAATLALALALCAGTARAQSATDAALRLELIEQARQARAAGDHERALDLASRAGRIQMTTSLRMFLAEEQQTTGRVADALANADLCAREAEHDTALRNRDRILAVCRDIGAAMRPRVGRLTVRVPAPAPAGLTVRVAGAPLSDAFYGIPYVVTPGDVAVDATAPGREDFHAVVPVVAGAGADVTLWSAPAAGASTPAGSATPAGSPAPAGDSAAAATSSGSSGSSSGHGPAASTPSRSASVAALPPPEPVRPEPAAQSSGGPPVGAIALLGAGVVGLGLGVAFAVLRGNAVGNFENNYCDPPDHNVCVDTDASRAALGDANTWTIATDVSLGVGAAALLVGGAMFILGRSHEGPPRASLTVSPIAGGAVLGVGGSL